MPRRTVDPIYIPAAILVPAGTTAAAPLVTPLPVEPGILQSVDLQIPPGHSGVTGIRFTLSGQQILPWSNTPAWITADNFAETFAVDVEVDTLLAAVCFNIGNFDHTFFCRFRISQKIDAGAPPTLRLISNQQLSTG